MNMIVEDIREALPEISRLLMRIVPTLIAPDPPQKQAIRAVWTAVDLTRMHLAKIRSGKAKVNEPNPELVEFWREASLQIATFDQELANKLRMKAELWSDPFRWDDARIREAGLQIEEITDKARTLLQLAVPTPPQRMQANVDTADFFISHASEDKNAVAEPLANALRQRGSSVWYDNFSLQLGNSLREEIDRGLSACRYGVAILSPHFFAKRWPQLELNGLLALETADGRKRILPVRHQLDQAALAAQSPTLADRLAVSTELGINEVANQIVQRCQVNV